MKIKVKREEFLTALKRVAAIIPNKPILDANSYVLMERDDAKASISLTSNTLEVFRQAWVGVDPGASFPKLMVPAKRIVDYLSRIVDADLELEPVADVALNIKHGAKKAKFNCMNTQFFPSFGVGGPSDAVATVDGKEFKRAMRQVLIACPSSHSKHELTGVNVMIMGNRMVLNATDVKVIAQSRLDAVSVIGEGSFLVPGKHLTDLIRVLNDTDPVEISCNQRTISFKTPTFSQESVGLNGKHPVNGNLFKLAGELGSFETPKEEFLDTLDRMMPLLEGTTDSFKVKVDINGSDMKMEGVCKELGEVEDTLAINPLSKIDPCSFKVDARSVVEVLKAMDAAQLNVTIGSRGCLVNDPGQARYVVCLAS